MSEREDSIQETTEDMSSLPTSLEDEATEEDTDDEQTSEEASLEGDLLNHQQSSPFLATAPPTVANSNNNSNTAANVDHSNHSLSHSVFVDPNHHHSPVPSPVPLLDSHNSSPIHTDDDEEDDAREENLNDPPNDPLLHNTELLPVDQQPHHFITEKEEASVHSSAPFRRSVHHVPHSASSNRLSYSNNADAHNNKAPINHKFIQHKINQYLGQTDPYILQQLSYSKGARELKALGAHAADFDDRFGHFNLNALAKRDGHSTRSSNAVNGNVERMQAQARHEKMLAQRSNSLNASSAKLRNLSNSWIWWRKNKYKPRDNSQSFFHIWDEKMKMSSSEWKLSGKTFFLFSKRSWLRRLGLHLMKNNLVFIVSAILTIINLVWFVLERSPQYASRYTPEFIHKNVLPHYQYYMYGYMGLYTLEIAFRMLVLGIFTGRYSFFRNNWNLFEFLILLFSLIFIYWINLSILRIFIIFRFLEGFSIFNSLKAIYESIWGALPRLRGVIVFMIFVLYMFSVTGVDFFRHNLTKKCGIFVDNSTGGKEFLPAIPEQWCSTNSFGFQCPGSMVCEIDQPNPNFGLNSFDNFASSLLLTFQIVSISSWSAYYYMVSNTEFFVIAFFWFFSLILLVSFVILNLVVVAIDSVFDVLRYYTELARKRKSLRYMHKTTIAKRALQALPWAIILSIERRLPLRGWFRKVLYGRYIAPLVCFPRNLLRFIVQTMAWDITIMLIILSNVVLEVLFSYNVLGGNVSDSVTVKSLVNWVYIGVYSIEIFICMLALGPLTYLKNNFNKFDVGIVVINIIMTASLPTGSVFENIMTQLRLLRVFSILSRLSFFHTIMVQTFASLLSLFNLVIFVLVTTYGFAVVGNQLFGKVLSNPNEPNFSDITNSMLSCFKVLTGDSWEKSMYAAAGQSEDLIAKYLAIPFFIVYFMLARYVLMSMFTVVVLEAFSSAKTDGAGKSLALKRRVAQARALIVNAFSGNNKTSKLRNSNRLSRKEVYYTNVQLMDQDFTSGDASKDSPPQQSRNADRKYSVSSATSSQTSKRVRTRISRSPMELQAESGSSDSSKRHHRRTSSVSSTATTSSAVLQRISRAESIFMPSNKQVERKSSDHIDSFVRKALLQDSDGKPQRKNRIFCIPFTSPIRRFFKGIVDSQIFQSVMLLIIFLAALSLTLEEPPSSGLVSSNTGVSTYRTIIFAMDIFFFIVFFGEFILKFLAKGAMLYIRDPLNLLDVVLIAELATSIAFYFIFSEQSSDVRAYIRLVRALRPLRLILKLPDLRLYMRAMRSGVRSFLLVLIIGVLIVFAFSLICTRLFAGSHLYCNDPSVSNAFMSGASTSLKDMCVGYFTNSRGVLTPRAVRNKSANFDTVANSFFALMEISSLSNWTSIIWPCLWSDFDGLLSKEFRIEVSLIFVVFIVLLVFFVLNLFIGVIISEIEKQRNQSELTARQKYWSHLKRHIMLLNPESKVIEPKFLPLRLIFRVVSSWLWNFLIGCMIFGTTIIFASQFSQQPDVYGYVLDGIVAFVMFVLLLECLLKILVYGHLYFSSWWHIVYTAVLSLTIIGIIVCLAVSGLQYEPIRLTMKVGSRVLLLIRIIKIAMVFRSVRFMLETLYSALPSLFNTFIVLALVFISYALIGMQLFANVKYQSFIGTNMNFRSMHKGLITLLRVMTLENWNGLMYDVAIEGKECTTDVDCGNRIAAWAFFFTFFLLAAHILLSLLLGIVLDFFSHSFSSIPKSISERSIRQFVQIWKKFDPKAKGRIRFHKFGELNEELLKCGNELAFDRSLRLDNDKFLLAQIELQSGVQFSREELNQFSITARFGLIHYLKTCGSFVRDLICCRLSKKNASQKRNSNRYSQASDKQKAWNQKKSIGFNACLIVLCRNHLDPQERTINETRNRAQFLAHAIRQMAAIKIQRFYYHFTHTEAQNRFRDVIHIVGSDMKQAGAVDSSKKYLLEDQNGQGEKEKTVEDFADQFFANI